MKTVILILAVCVTTVYSDGLTTNQLNKLEQYAEECTPKTGVSVEMFQQFLQPNGEVKRTRPIDCFFACIYKKVGLMKQDGTIDQKAADADYNDETLKAVLSIHVIKSCKHVVGKDACDTAGSIFACSYKQAHTNA